MSYGDFEFVFSDNTNYDGHCHYLLTPLLQGQNITCLIGSTPKGLTFQLEDSSTAAVCHSSPSCYFHSSLLKMILCHFNSHYSNTFINIYGEFWDSRKEGVKCEGGQWRLFYSHIPGHGNYSMQHLNSNHLLQMRQSNTDGGEKGAERVLIGSRPHSPTKCLILLQN